MQHTVFVCIIGCVFCVEALALRNKTEVDGRRERERERERAQSQKLRGTGTHKLITVSKNIYFRGCVTNHHREIM